MGVRVRGKTTARPKKAGDPTLVFQECGPWRRPEPLPRRRRSAHAVPNATSRFSRVFQGVVVLAGVQKCGARPISLQIDTMLQPVWIASPPSRDLGRGAMPVNARLPAQIGCHRCGPGQPLLVIAGPCVIQTQDLCLRIAEALAVLASRLPIQVVFKASYDKANRTSASSFRGPGIDDGLAVLERVRRETGLPVTTDVHLPEQAAAAGQVCDMLQIPAFLCRQTDILLAAAATGRAVNVKKGQFVAPGDMRHAVAKLLAGGATDILLCERGTFFGYGRLVNDFTGLPVMQSFGVPVIFDATHSVQQPASLGGATGGDRTLVEPLARAAAAVGVDGMFFETHPCPDESPSDGANMVPLDQFGGVLERVLRIHEARLAGEKA